MCVCGGGGGGGWANRRGLMLTVIAIVIKRNDKLYNKTIVDY